MSVYEWVRFITDSNDNIATPRCGWLVPVKPKRQGHARVGVMVQAAPDQKRMIWKNVDYLPCQAPSEQQEALRKAYIELAQKRVDAKDDLKDKARRAIASFEIGSKVVCTDSNKGTIMYGTVVDIKRVKIIVEDQRTGKRFRWHATCVKHQPPSTDAVMRPVTTTTTVTTTPNGVSKPPAAGEPPAKRQKASSAQPAYDDDDDSSDEDNDDSDEESKTRPVQKAKKEEKKIEAPQKVLLFFHCF